MIEVEAVQPTAKEFRSIKRGWGVIHWVCVLPTYAFLMGFLVYGLIASSLADDLLPPFMFSGCLVASWVAWFFGSKAARWAATSEARKSPTGALPWKWSLDSGGVTFSNGLQTNTLNWRAVKTVLEEKDRFLFLVTPAYNPVLPKRLLSEDQLRDIRQLISEVNASGDLGRGVD